MDGIVILTVPNGYSATEVLVNRLLASRGGRRVFERLTNTYRLVSGVPDVRPFSSSQHLQSFTFGRIRRTLNKHGLLIAEASNANLGLPIPGVGRTQWLKRLECRLADFAPRSLAGGWFLVLTAEETVVETGASTAEGCDGDGG